MAVRLCVMASLLMALGSATAAAFEATEWFDEGVRRDLGNSAEAARSAFSSFRRAAEAGLPEAELNVAIMLDSGRGVDRDAVQAAIWYARSATHGNRRAAYNLGQLYEAGEGVPLNLDVARAWFALCALPAAREHLAVRPLAAREPAALSAPVPLSPRSGLTIDPGQSGIELVWTSMPQPEAVRFFVELRALDRSGSREVFSGSSDVTSIMAAKPDQPGIYAWRVLAIAPRAAQYTTSEWLVFRVANSPAVALQ